MKTHTDEQREKLISVLNEAIAKVYSATDYEVSQMVVEWNLLSIEDLGYSKIIEQEIKLTYREIQWKDEIPNY